MYADYGQMQKYEEYIQERAREFRDAQADAAWMMMWLGRGVNTIGQWLVWWGQRLQTSPADKPSSFSPSALSTHRTM
jgi:hypothetical protein